MCVGILMVCGFIFSANQEEEVLFNFADNLHMKMISASDAEFKADRESSSLIVQTGHSSRWPGITLRPVQGKWDLSRYQSIVIRFSNPSDKSLRVYCRVDNPGADGVKNCITESIDLVPKQTSTLKIKLPRALPPELASKLFGMRGYPGGLLKESPIDLSNITQLVIFVYNPSTDHTFEVESIKAVGLYVPPEWFNKKEDFFPFIDEYGQFIHKDWPNKVKSQSDLERHKTEEQRDLNDHPSPRDWNEYGGWLSGPQLKATGFFRTEKYQGKWWLVDPTGRLFWSHGIDCVNDWNGTTPITDREHWFKDLPNRNSEFGKFYSKASWAPHNYYEGRVYETYNFTASNLFRKYGPSWKDEFAEISHRRLRSWGMNTIANWSDAKIYLMRKTPYVVSVSSGGRRIEGSEGYWGKFPDVFDPSFEAELRKNIAWHKETTANDPWCIGYFVDNELGWGDETSLALSALMSPPDQQAKIVFVNDLKQKYGSIDNLNSVWGTDYASWDDMINNKKVPNKEKAYNDLVSFYQKTAEQYFRICRNVVKEIAPNNLYLGCRFAWVNDIAVRASAKFCDVISYNLYWREVSGFKLPEGLDMPVIIGEFHFGALDRGMFHTGLQATENQEERAKAYINYVTSALRNPFIVGSHWFQYGDQATTGRGDGENYQIGFLDIADTPYAETIRACREVGYKMYQTRMQ